MRKYIREIFRNQGISQKCKPSKYVRSSFSKLKHVENDAHRHINLR